MKAHCELESEPKRVLCYSAKGGPPGSWWLTMRSVWVSSTIKHWDMLALCVSRSQSYFSDNKTTQSHLDWCLDLWLLSHMIVVALKKKLQHLWNKTLFLTCLPKMSCLSSLQIALLTSDKLTSLYGIQMSRDAFQITMFKSSMGIGQILRREKKMCEEKH